MGVFPRKERKMPKVDKYTVGVKAKSIGEIPSDLFEKEENDYLVAQAMRIYINRAYKALSKVKTRGEVLLTKSKWYRQKGTGRARHGAKSAPIFVGGGKAHGPRGIKRELELPLKMKRKALSIVLNKKLKDKKIFLIDGVAKIKKTKETYELVRRIAGDKMTRTTVVLSMKNKDKAKFFRNIDNLSVLFFESLNAYSVFYGGLLLFDVDVFKAVNKEEKKK